MGATVQAHIAARLLAAQHHPDWPAVGSTALAHVLTGGDDYELCFTAPPEAIEAVLQAARLTHTPVTRIGRIEAEPGLRLVDAQQQPLPLTVASYDHFAQP